MGREWLVDWVANTWKMIGGLGREWIQNGERVDREWLADWVANA